MENILIQKIKNFLLNKLPSLNNRLIIERMEIDFIFSRLVKKKKLIILDVGAHHGEFLDIFSNLNFGSIIQQFEIYCFEPFVKNFKILKKKENYLSKNIKSRLYNFAISDKTEKKIFYIGTADSLITCETYWIRKFKKEFLKKKKILMQCLTFSDFIQKYSFNISQEIDLLKIDVEGHDFVVLKNIVSNNLKIKTIMIEFEVQNILKTRSIIQYLLLKKFTKIFIFARSGMITSYIGPYISHANLLNIIKKYNVLGGNLVAFK